MERPRIRLGERMLYALVEAVRWSERIKPSQHAKRMVFQKYGFKGGAERLLTAVYYGLLKRQGIIDRVIEDVTGVKPVYILDPWLRAGLRVAVEILVFRRPTEATRNMVRNVVAGFISKKTHPYVGMYYWRLIDRIIKYRYTPRNEVEGLEYKYLLPKWFIEKMIGLLGRGEAEELFKALNRTPPISVRVNILKTSVEKVIEELTSIVKWVEQSKVVDTVLRFPGPFPFEESRLWRKGYIVIQEEAAALASIILDPKPGEIVVDMAAAPGGKTEHMGELMGNKGIIYAFDIDELRIKRMKELLRRAGISIVRVIKEDSRKAPDILGAEIADKVLIDAPCTSDGTLAKNPDLRWRIRSDAIAEFAELQYGMLVSGWKLLKPGGRLLYCTCSMFREENEDIIEKFLQEYRDAELVRLTGPYSRGFLEGTMRAWPHRHNTIGFFYAILRKKR